MDETCPLCTGGRGWGGVPPRGVRRRLRHRARELRRLAAARPQPPRQARSREGTFFPPLPAHKAQRRGGTKPRGEGAQTWAPGRPWRCSPSWRRSRPRARVDLLPRARPALNLGLSTWGCQLGIVNLGMSTYWGCPHQAISCNISRMASAALTYRRGTRRGNGREGGLRPLHPQGVGLFGPERGGKTGGQEARSRRPGRCSGR